MQPKISYGGTELQYLFLKKYVDKDLLNSIDLKLIPNSNSYTSEIDVVSDKLKAVAWTQQAHDFLEAKKINDQINNLSKIVFVSNWQQHHYYKMFSTPPDKSVVIKNGIEPAKTKIKPIGRINLIYFSTPYRGLKILLDSLNYLTTKNYHLHVFSSMSIYGQDELDHEYEILYDRCRNHPNVSYYGSVSHSNILNVLDEMHIMAYPSTFEETSCIAVLEAMTYRLRIVCSNLGALPETTAGFGNIHPFTLNEVEHAKIHATCLNFEIENYKESNQHLQKQYVDIFHDWNVIKQQWVSTISEILKDNSVKILY